MIIVGKHSCVLLLLATLVIYNRFLLKLDFNDSHCLRSKALLFYYWKHAKRIYCLFEINALLEVDSVFKRTGLPECPKLCGKKWYWSFFLILQVVAKFVGDHSPIPSSGPESTLKCLAHGRGVVTSSQPSTFKRVWPLTDKYFFNLSSCYTRLEIIFFSSCFFT